MSKTFEEFEVSCVAEEKQCIIWSRWIFLSIWDFMFIYNVSLYLRRWNKDTNNWSQVITSEWEKSPSPQEIPGSITHHCSGFCMLAKAKDKLFKCGCKHLTKADHVAASPKWIPTSFVITSLLLRFAIRYLSYKERPFSSIKASQ